MLGLGEDFDYKGAESGCKDDEGEGRRSKTGSRQRKEVVDLSASFAAGIERVEKRLIGLMTDPASAHHEDLLLVRKRHEVISTFTIR